jgi:hypothetical protein
MATQVFQTDGSYRPRSLPGHHHTSAFPSAEGNIAKNSTVEPTTSSADPSDDVMSAQFVFLMILCGLAILAIIWYA